MIIGRFHKDPNCIQLMGFTIFKEFQRHCKVIFLIILVVFSISVISQASAKIEDESIGNNRSIAVYSQDTTAITNNDDVSTYIAEYLNIMPSFIVKQIVNKVVGRYTKSAIVTEDLKAAYPLIVLTGFLNENVAETTRNIYPMIKKAKAKEDYKEAGEIIRNSIIGHIIVLPLQIGIGYGSAPAFKNLGLPDEACDMVDVYFKHSVHAFTIHEFSGKTAEVLLLIEHPSLQWVPTVLHTSFMLLFYKLNDDGSADAMQHLSQLALSETGASAITAALVFGYIMQDSAYEKYELTNFSMDELIHVDTLEEIAEYGFPVFISHAIGTYSGIMDILLIGMVGTEELGAKKDFDQIALLLKTIIVASSKASGFIVANSLADDEDVYKTKAKMYKGFGLNSILASGYLVIAIYPGLITSPEEYDVIRILATNNFFISLNRAVKDELSAFKYEDQSWLTTVSNVAKIAIPTTGVILFRTGVVKPNMRNYRIIQFTSFIPTILAIFSLFQVAVTL